MTEQEALQLLTAALAISAQAPALLAQLEANWEAVKAAYSSTDAAALRERIDAEHADITALGAKLDALRG